MKSAQTIARERVGLPRSRYDDFERLDPDSIQHRDGVPWCVAPKPRRFRHRHTAQTTSNVVERCACGATRFVDDPVWIDEREPRFRGWL